MIKVITYGTFDLFHYGHLNLLKRAAKLGDHLTVGLSTDEFNLIKGKRCVQSYEERKENLSQLSIVDKIIPENNWGQKEKDITNSHISILVMGDDWQGVFDFLDKFCKVIYLPRTPKISTSLIKKRVCRIF